MKYQAFWLHRQFLWASPCPSALMPCCQVGHTKHVLSIPSTHMIGGFCLYPKKWLQDGWSMLKYKKYRVNCKFLWAFVGTNREPVHMSLTSLYECILLGTTKPWESKNALLSLHILRPFFCRCHQHPRMWPTVSKRFLVWCGKAKCPAMISDRFQHNLDMECHICHIPSSTAASLTSDSPAGVRETSGKWMLTSDAKGHGKYQPSQDHIVEVEMTGWWQRRRQPRTESRNDWDYGMRSSLKDNGKLP